MLNFGTKIKKLKPAGAGGYKLIAGAAGCSTENLRKIADHGREPGVRLALGIARALRRQPGLARGRCGGLPAAAERREPRPGSDPPGAGVQGAARRAVRRRAGAGLVVAGSGRADPPALLDQLRRRTSERPRDRPDAADQVIALLSALDPCDRGLKHPRPLGQFGLREFQLRPPPPDVFRNRWHRPGFLSSSCPIAGPGGCAPQGAPVRVRSVTRLLRPHTSRGRPAGRSH